MINGGLRTKDGIKISKPEKPLITIVTVVYNGAKNLEQTILSVVNQTYDNVEYIIIDGGSTDGTLDIIKKYEYKIDYWQSEPDQGIYDAMNKGIDFANGDWINFMNCGDVFYNENIVDEIFSNKKYDATVIYGNTIERWTEGDKFMLPNSKDYVMPFCHQSCFTKTFYLKKYHFDICYKICADRNFYSILEEDGISDFYYLNKIISIFDCIDSTSMENEILTKKEMLRVANVKNIKYFILMLRTYMIFYIKKICPNKILCLHRKKRIKINNRNNFTL